MSQMGHACYRCQHDVTDVNMINTSLFAPSKKITPQPPPSPRLRSASFTTNVLGVPCVAAHTRQRQGARALRGSVCREALASDALRFTRARCQSAFDASNTTLTLLGLERHLPRCAFCSLSEALEEARHNPCWENNPMLTWEDLMSTWDFFQNAMLGKKCHVDIPCQHGTSHVNMAFFSQHGIDHVNMEHLFLMEEGGGRATVSRQRGL